MVDNSALKRIDKYNFSLKNIIGEGSYAKVYKGKIDKTN